MKVKNKVITALLTLTCIFSLTACSGSEDSVSQLTQQKISMVESKADVVLNIMPGAVEDAVFNEYVNECNNVELADMFASYTYSMTQGSAIEAEGKAVRNAVTSFKSAKESVGAISAFGEKETVVDDDTIIITVPATCENGTGSVELIFSNDIYGKLESCTFNVSQTMGDLMVKAGLNTLIGMGTVFVVLILISGIISCFAVIPKLQEKMKKKSAPAPVKEAEVVVADETEELADDLELVAVIAAAIAAYEGTSTDGFAVRSIKRSKTSKWKKA